MSFGQDILEAFAAHGDRVAIVSGRQQITYSQCLAQIGHLATNFKASGLRPGDRVGLGLIVEVEVPSIDRLNTLRDLIAIMAASRT